MKIPVPTMTIDEYEKRFARQPVPAPVAIAQANGEKQGDPQTEASIAAFVACDNHILTIEDHELKDSDFSVTHWGIVYGAAKAVSDKGLKVCIASINDYIEKNALPEFKRSLGHDNSMPNAWRKWPDMAVEISGSMLTANSVRWGMDDVARYAQNRHDHEIRLGLANHTIDWQEAVELHEEVNGEDSGELPKIEDSFDLCQQSDDTPPQIVAGVFHQGSKVMLAGGSKSFKTWQLLQLAVCVSSGRKWLKFNTFKGKVLYVNFELPKWSIRKRISDIQSALGVESVRGNLETWNLRGYAASGEEILPQIAQRAAKRQYALIVLDPLYKLLGTRDENSASDMANLMNEVEKITVKTLAAIAFGTHFSKGNQAAKEAIDRMSGSGVLARDPDSMIISTEHEQENAFSVSMILRNLPAQDEFVMRFNAPIMMVDETLDPDELKQAAKNVKLDDDELIALLGNTGLSYSDWLKTAKEQLGCSKASFNRHRIILSKIGKIFQSPIDDLWSVRI